MAFLRIPRHRLFGLRNQLGALLTGLALLVGLTLAFIGYHMMVTTAASRFKDKVSDTTTIVKNETIHGLHDAVQLRLDTLAQSPLITSRSLEDRLEYLPVMKNILETLPILNNLYIGYENGDFFMLYRLDEEKEQKTFNAPEQSAYVVVNVQRKGSIAGQSLFFDKDLRFLESKDGVFAPFDPRTRPWYQEAMRVEGHIETPPHLTAAGEPVTAFARKAQGGMAVVGADIGLTDFSTFLKQELPTPGARLALLGADGTLVARAGGMIVENDDNVRVRTTEDLRPILRMAAQAYQEGQRGRGIILDDGEQEWEVSLEEFNYNDTTTNAILLAIPQRELRSSGRTFLLYALLGTAGLLLLCAPFIGRLVRNISTPLQVLAARAENLHEVVREPGEPVHSTVPEIEALSLSMRHLQGTIRKMLTITQTINSERDFDALLQRVLGEILSVVKADGGTVALLDEEKRIILNQGGVCWIIDGEKKNLPFAEALQKPGMRLPIYQSLMQDRLIHDSITRGEERGGIEPVATGFLDPGVHAIDIVSIPLHDRMGEHTGVIALFKAVKNGGDGFRPEEVEFIESLAATAGIALENQRLITGQNKLRDALIHILAGAIDAKSPYTGGHCQRVPVLFQMLLKAACEAGEGPFKNFTLNEDGWEEARLAGWLHDCGKVTTPEYVLDKATKLETLYDRIHEIRTRFEVLKRDAEIACLRAVAEGADPENARRELEKELRALDEDFAFVAACNAGGEHIDDKALARLVAIGKRPWLRTLDKGLGVSQGEKARMDAAAPEPPLPVWETLLMDTPEHIIPRGEKDMLDPGNPWGFQLTPPNALYNRGELYNLSIRRGTLSEEERYKINDHITRTIIMLAAMPLPRHLRNVPEIAGAHHETMDGKGYPRKLARGEMSWGARMMAVADIFEALTACDRPYKSSKTLQETLNIMNGFRDRKHIDPDVYELFLTSDIPRRYAEEFLMPEQNDL